MIENLVVDCDGTLTDGKYYYTKEGKTMTTFHANDSYAMKTLAKEDSVRVIMITSGSYAGINEKRAQDLDLEIFSTPVGNKLQLLKDLGLNLEKTAYVGDCLDDIPVLEAVGFSYTPSDALDMVKNSADIVLKRGGGTGCILEAYLDLRRIHGR